MNLVIVSLGLVGNGLVMAALRSEVRSSATSFLLVVLAVADSLVLVTAGFMMVVVE